MTISGDLNLQAGASSMASWIDNDLLSVTGSSNVGLYLTPDVWHFVSSPISDALSIVFKDIYLRSFDEASDSWNPYIVPNTIPLTVMKGYAAWVPSSAASVTYSGTVNSGAMSIGITRNTTQVDQGWNLVGNPYPSSLDWDATSGWTKATANNTIYYYSGNGGLGNYKYYQGAGGELLGVGTNAGTNEIPPMQGFFVHASGNGIFGVNNDARIHSNQAYYKQGIIEDCNQAIVGINDLRMIRIEDEIKEKPEKHDQPQNEYIDEDQSSNFVVPILRLIVNLGDLSDETVIRFYEGAENDFEGEYDALKLLGNGYPQVYSTTVSGTDLAINTLPEYNESTIIPVGFVPPESGMYQLSLIEFKDFQLGTNLYLEDLITGEVQKINELPEYHFVSSVIDDPHRFNLYFKESWYGVDDNLASKINIYSAADFVYILTPDMQTGDVFIYDMLGQEILNQRIGDSGMTKIRITNGTAYYLVKFQSDEILVTEKVFIK